MTKIPQTLISQLGLPLAFLGCILFATPSSGGEADDLNLMCPVLQDREATADYATTYKGRKIRFCCSECVVEFQENPEIYENAVPQLQDLPLRHQLKLFFGDYGGMVVGGSLLSILIALRIYRWKHPVAATSSNSRIGGILTRRMSPVIPLIILTGYLGYEVWSLQHQLHLKQLEDEIHYATFYDFGYPPVPRRPDTEKRVAASFYRGNDERSPKLFNEGNYRTATFHVSLCDADGQVVDTQAKIPDSTLFVRLEVERPPFTPDFLYCPEMMNTMFLTTECDRFLEATGPVPDRVNLTETEPMQRWEALYPLKRTSTCCRGTNGERLRGTIYVCQVPVFTTVSATT
jgi:YHS domain-containing protein